MQNLKKIIFILAFIVLVFQLLSMKTSPNIGNATSKPIVAVSTFSLYDITKYISSKTVKIVNILPFGVDAHSFEPTPKLMASLEESKLVIYNGAGLEPWLKGFEFKNLSIDMSKKVRLRELQADEHHHHDEYEHSSSTLDPHYWLDLQNMKISTHIITDALIKIAPQNRDIYVQNRDKYLAILDNLDAQYQRVLGSCKKDTIITNHNAFSYLSNKYNFNVEALSGLSPDAQPSAKQITKLMQHIKEHDINTIFFESFVSDRVMKSIAKDTKVNVDTLQPLGNITKDEAENNATYESIMKENLKKISKALMCQ